MKVLITGSSGFLGSWICRVLAEKHEVIGLVRETSELGRISDLKNVRITRLETTLWSNYIIESRPDVLILNHWSGVSNERRNDLQQIENVRAIHELAAVAVTAGVKTIIGVGSQAELGPVESAISEIEVDNPTTVYGRAKVETRLSIQSLIEGSGVRFIWMRIFSTYGPLDDGPWLIPNIVDSLVNNQKINLTKGEQKWSYLHAYDLATAFAAVIENSNVDGIVSVGNPKTITIFEVASIIGEILKKKNLLAFGALDYRPDQVMRLQPLCETLTGLGWRPQIGFVNGVKQTIDWLQGKNLEPLETELGKILKFKIPSRL
jgi:UDP-glucose 4-epimerase